MKGIQQRTCLLATVATLCMAFLLMPHASMADINEWTWMSGSKQRSQDGIYGSKGTPDAANVPGARQESISWTDQNGNLWLFGGNGSDSASTTGELNDLWRYDPATDEWTWMSGSNRRYQEGTHGTRGVADPDNMPGARLMAIAWTDSAGNFWLFGGYGYDGDKHQGDLNDLWRYDPAADEWTWMSGSTVRTEAGVYGTKGTPDAANMPGAREKSVSWIDSAGRLWLLGGYGYDSDSDQGGLNDLWRYDPAADAWTWMSGSDLREQTAVYGTKGTPDAANMPGAREKAIAWTGLGGNLWLFGGYGYDSTDTQGDLNDLWRYDLTSGEWTWVSGSNTRTQTGVYGTQGKSDAANVPGSRVGAITWTDNAGRLWLFGGYGNDSTGTGGQLNDLWRYDPALNEWTWVSGSNLRGQIGTFGTRGTADALNMPGSREEAVSWTDGEGNLWLFGGYGNDNESAIGDLNDLWRYETPEAPLLIDKCKVKAGKTDNTDSIKFSGLMGVTEDEVMAEWGGVVTVSLVADFIPDPSVTVYEFPINEETFRKGKFKAKVKPLDKSKPATSFAFDTIKGKMKFSAKNTDLTGLKCPIVVRIQIGDYIAGAVMGENIVNGKKPCPPQLLMGVYDSLDATNVKAQKSTTAGSDKISISGTFTIDGFFDTNEQVDIIIGSDTFTVPGAAFVENNGSYSCKSFNSGSGLVTATFDTVKCTYQISIQNTTLSDSGNVDFSIDIFKNLLHASDQITLPPNP